MKGMVWFLSAVCAVWCAVSVWANPITNGGFEVLDAQGRPVDWEFVGEKVSVTTDARSGKYALRFERGTGRDVPPETGLNREWSPNSGRQGKMLAEVRGGVVFWYRLVSAEPGASVQVVVIPMSDRPFEDTGSPRAMYQIPLRHAGDGKWHQGKLAYDFTRNPKVKWVHVGVRLTGAPAVLIVDDMEYVERVGAVLRFEKMHFYPDATQPDRAGMFTAAITNDGDAPSSPVRVTLTTPQGLRATPLVSPAPRPVAPEAGIVYRWRIEGVLNPCTLRLLATDGAEAVEQTFHLAPRVELESALMRPAMVAPGGRAEVAVTVWNRGTATARDVRVRVRSLAPRGALQLRGNVAVSVPPIPPTGRRTVRIPVRAGRLPGEWQVSVEMTPEETARGTLIVTDALRQPVQHVVGPLWIRRGSDRTIGELRVGNRVVARMPHLGSVAVRLPDGRVQRLFARYTPSGVRRSPQGATVLSTVVRDGAGGRWNFSVSVETVQSNQLSLSYACAPDRPREVLAFEGPLLLVGDGDTGEAKHDALLPGLEWLTAEEVSSSDLDIARDHPDRIRFVPHPHKVTIPAVAVRTPAALVGVMWDVHEEWSKGYRLPQPIFAVPDRLRGTASHRLGLMAPNVVAGLPENALVARKPFRIDRSDSLRLNAHVRLVPADRDILQIVREWFRHFRPEPPLPAPQGSDKAQIAWSMKAYTDTLWVSDREGWLPFLGGPGIWRSPAFRADYAYDLVKALLVVPDATEAERWQARLEAALPRIEAPQAEDLALEYGDALNTLTYLRQRAMELIQTQNNDGSWGFDADRRDTGVFKRMDYHELGPPNAVELGTIARNAYEILRYARISGNGDAYRAGVRALQAMRRFTVPRAAQVWEVPVHTPDILAAADAIDAYIEAYWYDGDRRWLREAQRWAWAGLPFVYVWNADGKPWMRYGSIPVFGATWYQGSWFGNIVQWNGLRYAYALFKLCEADPHAEPVWKQVATGITRCAMYQQSTSGDNLALWPDSYHTITDVRAAWDFAPRQILKNVYHLLGREEEPRTWRLQDGVRLTTSGQISKATLAGNTLRAEVRNPPGESGQLLVSAVAVPQAVLVNGKVVNPVDQFSRHDRRAPCWRYAHEHRALTIWYGAQEQVEVEIQGYQPMTTPSLPVVATRLRFEFDEDTEGWVSANHLALVEVRDGSLRTRATGGDPYMIRWLCRFAPDSIRHIRLRVRGTGSSAWQFYWGTLEQPFFDEARVINFTVPMDGQWHEVVLNVGGHPGWQGHTITAIRLDPGNAADTEAEIDWIRAE